MKQPTDGTVEAIFPHFDGDEITQFVTFRLADSLPQQLLDNWRSELREEGGASFDTAMRRRIELYLDQGYGLCYLKHPGVAELVQCSLLFFDRERYKLSSWVIMPNHVHALLTPCAGYELSKILQSLKSFTANEANKILMRRGKFWQQESFDRYIRDRKHFASVVRYIEDNPVKARLSERPEDWPYSSAWFRAAGSADILSANAPPGA